MRQQDGLCRVCEQVDDGSASQPQRGGREPGVPVAQDVALIEAGFDVKVNDRATVGLSYQGQFGDGSQENGVNAALHVRF